MGCLAQKGGVFDYGVKKQVKVLQEVLSIVFLLGKIIVKYLLFGYGVQMKKML